MIFMRQFLAIVLVALLGVFASPSIASARARDPRVQAATAGVDACARACLLELEQFERKQLQTRARLESQQGSGELDDDECLTVSRDVPSTIALRPTLRVEQARHASPVVPLHHLASGPRGPPALRL